MKSLLARSIVGRQAGDSLNQMPGQKLWAVNIYLLRCFHIKGNLDILCYY